uniref:Uncharacterized protein n=1 Tax=Lactuca sativa TaxID=4236 RepID=A0A9R1WRN1_LACSA|nr:hypothetical protein LSAT_V11C100040680 [Lactuca sativa]
MKKLTNIYMKSMILLFVLDIWIFALAIYSNLLLYHISELVKINVSTFKISNVLLVTLFFQNFSFKVQTFKFVLILGFNSSTYFTKKSKKSGVFFS